MAKNIVSDRFQTWFNKNVNGSSILKLETKDDALNVTVSDDSVDTLTKELFLAGVDFAMANKAFSIHVDQVNKL